MSKVESLQNRKPTLLRHKCFINAAAVTAKEYVNNDLNEKYTEKSLKAKKPKWIINIEEKITQIRRFIGHLTTIINCKKRGIFAKHIKNLKEKIL